MGSDASPGVTAIYAAIIGTAGFLLSLYLALRDRARLEVAAGPDDPARKDIRPDHDTEPRFLVHIRNRGRRPVSIERIWYTRYSTGKVRHLLSDRFDFGTEVIGEGESSTHELYFRDVTPEDLGKIVVESQDGRKWSGKYDIKAKPFRWNK